MDGVDHHRFAGKPRPRPQQPFQLAALAQILIAAQRGDHLLTDLPTVTATFNDLEMGASPGGLGIVPANIEKKEAALLALSR
jgi:hypothetical protein